MSKAFYENMLSAILNESKKTYIFTLYYNNVQRQINHRDGWGCGGERGRDGPGPAAHIYKKPVLLSGIS